MATQDFWKSVSRAALLVLEAKFKSRAVVSQWVKCWSTNVDVCLVLLGPCSKP